MDFLLIVLVVLGVAVLATFFGTSPNEQFSPVEPTTESVVGVKKKKKKPRTPEQQAAKKARRRVLKADDKFIPPEAHRHKQPNNKPWLPLSPGRIAHNKIKHEQRSAHLKNAHPVWNEEEIEAIRDIYQERYLPQWKKVNIRVDHIVPIRSRLVCGLHTVANLRTVPTREDILKGNKIPGMSEKEIEETYRFYAGKLCANTKRPQHTNESDEEYQSFFMNDTRHEFVEYVKIGEGRYATTQ